MTTRANWQKAYSDRLHACAGKWGYNPPTDRPIINDSTFKHHYPAQRLDIVEVLNFAHGKSSAQIEIFTLNGLWSYCLNIRLRIRGMGFGPFLKFCEPYPTQTDATLAAGRAVADYLKTDRRDPNDTKMLHWARTLGLPKQMMLL